MKKGKVVGVVVGCCVTIPIWLVLLYHILVAIDADRMLWLLYWVYIPVGVFSSLLTQIYSSDD